MSSCSINGCERPPAGEISPKNGDAAPVCGPCENAYKLGYGVLKRRAIASLRQWGPEDLR